MSKKINNFGLKEKPSYEELFDYVLKDPDKVKYPNLSATISFNSIKGQQYRGIGTLEMERQHMRKLLDNEKNTLLRQFAHHYGLRLSDVVSYVESNSLHPFRTPPQGSRSRSLSPSRVSIRTPSEVNTEEEENTRFQSLDQTQEDEERETRLTRRTEQAREAGMYLLQQVSSRLQQVGLPEDPRILTQAVSIGAGAGITVGGMFATAQLASSLGLAGGPAATLLGLASGAAGGLVGLNSAEDVFLAIGQAYRNIQQRESFLPIDISFAPRDLIEQGIQIIFPQRIPRLLPPPRVQQEQEEAEFTYISDRRELERRLAQKQQNAARRAEAILRRSDPIAEIAERKQYQEEQIFKRFDEDPRSAEDLLEEAVLKQITDDPRTAEEQLQEQIDEMEAKELVKSVFNQTQVDLEKMIREYIELNKNDKKKIQVGTFADQYKNKMSSKDLKILRTLYSRILVTEYADLLKGQAGRKPALTPMNVNIGGSSSSSKPPVTHRGVGSLPSKR